MSRLSCNYFFTHRSESTGTLSSFDSLTMSRFIGPKGSSDLWAFRLVLGWVEETFDLSRFSLIPTYHYRLAAVPPWSFGSLPWWLLAAPVLFWNQFCSGRSTKPTSWQNSCDCIRALMHHRPRSTCAVQSGVCESMNLRSWVWSRKSEKAQPIRIVCFVFGARTFVLRHQVTYLTYIINSKNRCKHLI